MRIRIVVSGVISGVFCLLALWFPWYMVEPAGIVPDWTFQSEANAFPPWVQSAVYVFCALTLFAFGWVAARWDWSKTWRSSILAGSGSGLIAGCILFDFIGAFHFGLLGQADILSVFYREVDNIDGLILLIDGITSSANLIYMNFVAALFASTLLGAMGGLASSMDLEDVWGKSPRKPDRWLFRLPAFTLSVTGVCCLIVVIAVFSVLEESMTKAMIDNDLGGLRLPPVFVLVSAYMACLAMTTTPIGVTWGWSVRAWRGAGWWKPLYMTWILATAVFVGWVLYLYFRNGVAGLAFALGVDPLLFLLIAILGGLALGFTAGMLSENPASTAEKYRFSDWLGYMLTQGILGGTQVFISVTAFALVMVLISIENIPHLTNTGLVELTPTQQVIQLFKIMSGIAQGMFVISAVGGWLFGLVVLLFRKFLKIKPVQTVENEAQVFGG